MLDRSARGGAVASRRFSPGFVAQWIFIAFVSVHDGFLVAIHRDEIAHQERNPVGQYLILLHGGEVELLLLAKLLGTAAACTLLLLIYQRHRRLGRAVTGGVAVWQLFLLLYLCFWP